ncbi:Phosphonate metabolism protein/1,5-bisphosphokinase (PRPP-forming) PhnN [Rhodovastum atsumiense]|uniref:Phosphonate metabolism protein/1,5-bisphosphokinase (PRPP-forming) PhnN n=1 Tax=Rhodovastum atsumiense TaxID=504468 RepID=A0A5M6IXE4_9PROT|nr:phosphonate metabolism protein/1,5-bisphosphokinase (PRPP-forming) PhnN [Rhodovastum atsumiense]KAA5612068.1 phosphonate metabolism protein/1,5-bisphosphokinase (PRPP-forming) PhnN [Rhodovastum atsumiense]CAH2604061.1 Phosphonate metabolism protein/1,5-bisphosphokinase (PRPP-forming) PhnN [Rhodovastum atsumiense]
MLVLVIGPSGESGTALLAGVRAALAGDDRFSFPRPQITRRASGNPDSHEPVDRESFELRRAVGAYAMSWQEDGIRYGIPAEIALDLDLGHIVVIAAAHAVIAEASRRFRVSVLESAAASPDAVATLVAELRLLARQLDSVVSLPG